VAKVQLEGHDSFWYTDGTTSDTIDSYTIGAHTNSFLAVWVSNRGNQGTPDTITWGGSFLVRMLENTTGNGRFRRISLYGLKNPTPGTANIEVSYSLAITSPIVIQVADFSGVLQWGETSNNRWRFDTDNALAINEEVYHDNANGLMSGQPRPRFFTLSVVRGGDRTIDLYDDFAGGSPASTVYDGTTGGAAHNNYSTWKLWQKDYPLGDIPANGDYTLVGWSPADKHASLELQLEPYEQDGFVLARDAYPVMSYRRTPVPLPLNIEIQVDAPAPTAVFNAPDAGFSFPSIALDVATAVFNAPVIEAASLTTVDTATAVFDAPGIGTEASAEVSPATAYINAPGINFRVAAILAPATVRLNAPEVVAIIVGPGIPGDVIGEVVIVEMVSAGCLELKPMAKSDVIDFISMPSAKGMKIKPFASAEAAGINVIIVDGTIRIGGKVASVDCCISIKIGTTSAIRLEGLSETVGGVATFDNTAVVNANMFELGTTTPVGGVTNPILMPYVPGSDGDYEGEIPAGAALVPGQRVDVQVLATLTSGREGEWRRELAPEYA